MTRLSNQSIPMPHCSNYVKARSHDPILRIRFLVPKIESRRSDDPISRFRFCGENVGRLFVVCSHDPIFRTNKESSIWLQNDHRDIMQNLSVPFIFQKDRRMKIEHALFPSVFSKLRIRVSEGHFQCVHTIRFSEPTKIGSLKTDRVNGPQDSLGIEILLPKLWWRHQWIKIQHFCNCRMKWLYLWSHVDCSSRVLGLREGK